MSQSVCIYQSINWNDDLERDTSPLITEAPLEAGTSPLITEAPLEEDSSPQVIPLEGDAAKRETFQIDLCYDHCTAFIIVMLPL